jgi:hypothetical protein
MDITKEQPMSERSIVDQYIDALSVRESREALECLITTYIFRAADVAPDLKLKGRTAQKRLAELLARTDAHWTVREIVLNAGRTLYFSTGPHHNYYGARLCEMVQEAAKKIGRASDGEAFTAAVERYDKEFAEAAGGTWGGDLLAASDEVIRLGTAIIKTAIDEHGADVFSKSERKALRGVVSAEVARQLAAAD